MDQLQSATSVEFGKLSGINGGGGGRGSFALFAPGTGWSSVSQVSGLAQVALGVGIFFASSLYLYHAAQFSGQLIGLLSVLLGLVGILGLRSKRGSMQMLFVVGMGMMAMMTFEFTVQVGRDIDADCSFAELYTRVMHVEDAVTALHRDEMTLQLFERLNEMDDMLDMIQDGTVERLQSESKAQNLMEQDSMYIGSKLEMLKKHADHVLEHLMSQESKAKAEIKTTNDPKANKKQREALLSLQQHLDNVEDVMKTIDAKAREDDGYTYEEYERLFTALLGSHPGSELLNHEKINLPFLKEAWERSSRGYLNDKSERAKAVEKHRDEQRELFERTFHETLDSHDRNGPPSLHRALSDALEDLPEHCLLETEHLTWFVWGGWLLIAAQVATAYVTATTVLVSNAKKDY